MPRCSNRNRFLTTPPAIGGRHELGQNWLIDRRFAAQIAAFLRHAPPYPVVELGAGNGAITEALVAGGAAVTALELDPRCVYRLRRRLPRRVEIVEADMLTFDFGRRPHHIVSNVPFSLTTALLRRTVARAHWHTAILLLQWEVARKRAGIGGTTMFTASWWPWFEFSLATRVPAAAFAPVPTVDGGILVIRRRETPLVPAKERPAYQVLIRVAFTDPSRGLPSALSGRVPTRIVRRWMSHQGLHPRTLPRELNCEQWVSLHELQLQRAP